MQYFFLNKLYNPGQAASSIYSPQNNSCIGSCFGVYGRGNMTRVIQLVQEKVLLSHGHAQDTQEWFPGLSVQQKLLAASQLVWNVSPPTLYVEAAGMIHVADHFCCFTAHSCSFLAHRVCALQQTQYYH